MQNCVLPQNLREVEAMNRRTVKRNTTARTAARGTISAQTVILLLLGACIVTAGFFLAALQHFNSIDLGIKNSALRRKLEDLDAENRRLLLMKEVALSPAEIKRSARRLGFREVNTAVAVIPAAAKTTTAAATTGDKKPTAVQTTASVRPVAAKQPAAAKPAESAAKREVKKMNAGKNEKKDAQLIAKLR